MNYKLFKHILTLFTISLLASTYAQTYEKKLSENFKTNKDVEVAIDASYTDINVSIWNKTEVEVNAFIEIEGITKKEAEKYFKDWEFEALGNSKKVKISSNCSTNTNFKDDFVFFDASNFDFQIPDIDFEEIGSIALENLDFDFDFNFEDLDDLADKMDKDDKYEFRWKDDEHDIKISSKEDWEAFKKTKDYAILKNKMKLNKSKMRDEIAKSKKELKLKWNKENLSIHKEEIRKQLEQAKEELKKINFKFKSKTDNININGKKVKINKRLEIKVPKNATFNLNTRHCKVKLPNTIAYGSVKYGSFNANNLNGGQLTIDYSPVNINDINACTLNLNNVTDAKIASVTNTTMNNNSSGVQVEKVNKNVTLSDKFGELKINSFHPNFGDFLLNVSQSNATIILGDVPCTFKYDLKRVKINNEENHSSTSKNTSTNTCKIVGAYSNVIIK